MFAVNIALGNTVWRLLFKDEEKAKTLYEGLSSISSGVETICLKDDFGQICIIKVEAFNGAMFEDLDKAKMANVELFLHQQRVQVMAQKAAQSDPGLRASATMNGPSVLTPFAGMPRN